MAAKLARSQRTNAPKETEGRSLLSVGDVLAGKYRVERILGEGGMGVVVAAHHQLLDQHVAVKLLYQDVADKEAQSRLLLEARSAAKLQSDHVARVIDVDTGADGLPFIVMELLEGADLCQIADARGALPRWLVVDYMLQSLEGLAHAHARGIVHRDLKPSNLFLANKPDGTQVIKILDFGISKSTSAQTDRRTAQLTGGRSVLGSPPYMSPEQVRAPKTVDHRTDIWSLGICMYELLTNSMPFGGDEIQETFACILEKEPAPIRQLVNGVPEGLERVVMRCLAKNRDERFTDVADLARALVAFGSGTWIQSADRVQATLVRGAEEAASAARLKQATVSATAPTGPIAIPSAPGKRNDSLQPELHGTASTVARGFTVLDSQRRWLMMGAAGVLVAALAAFVVVFVRSRSTPALEPTAQAAATTGAAAASPPQPTETPAETVDLAVGAGGPATQIVSPVHTAGPENELASPPMGTVIGASSPSAPASSASGKKAAAPVPTGRGFVTPPPVTTGARKAPPPPPTGPAKTLPPGLPRSRD
jgi:serine/threonine-protein kinase